ncbi:hypothetical protein HDU79_000238 [Rhizoclosmatium sp. JEL0117]|nr:hypothetical protein HDU79_000238 [Rhizoclosmatium sp. JEL0117]
MTAAYTLISRQTKDSPTRFLFVWWILCGSLHLFLEGYFISSYDTIAGDQTVIGAIWKEYAMSDSRYMTSDPFVVVIESLTVVIWGPLSYLAAYSLYISHPSQHLLQFVISCGHLYGLLMYYGTEMFDGFSHASPTFLHFYVYFLGFNFPWFVVPVWVILRSGGVIVRACAKFEGEGREVGNNKKSN